MFPLSIVLLLHVLGSVSRCRFLTVCLVENEEEENAGLTSSVAEDGKAMLGGAEGQPVRDSMRGLEEEQNWGRGYVGNNARDKAVLEGRIEMRSYAGR